MGPQAFYGIWSPDRPHLDSPAQEKFLARFGVICRRLTARHGAIAFIDWKASVSNAECRAVHRESILVAGLMRLSNEDEIRQICGARAGSLEDVLAAAYQRFGIAFAELLRGSFALAVLDYGKRMLV